MDRKVAFYSLFGIAAFAAMYLVSIGGFHLSPQKIRVSSGAIRKVANGRAQITVGQITYSVPLEIRCGEDSFSVDAGLDQGLSEKHCGVRVKTLEIGEGRFGAPSAVLEISWD